MFSLFAAIIGSISFWGSLVAFGKLQELLPGRPLTLGRPQTLLNGALAAAAIACAAADRRRVAREELLFVALLVAAGVLGVLSVLPIGGADMPVVISILNALTGLSAAATGVALNNTSLIVGGHARRRVGLDPDARDGRGDEPLDRVDRRRAASAARSVAAAAAGTGGTVRATSAADVAIQLAYAEQVVIVPGYGLAASQAQYAMREMTKLLEANGVEVTYAIHPVAGRMPGHMNVLLAEADVPYEQLVEMRDINPEFPRTDVAVLIGANDVVNPDARSNPQSPLFGMPILDVDEARSIIVLKRSMRSGYAGVDNPLFTDPKTSMLFGDAKESLGGGHGRAQGARRGTGLSVGADARRHAAQGACPSPSGTERHSASVAHRAERHDAARDDAVPAVAASVLAIAARACTEQSRPTAGRWTPSRTSAAPARPVASSTVGTTVTRACRQRRRPRPRPRRLLPASSAKLAIRSRTQFLATEPCSARRGHLRPTTSWWSHSGQRRSTIDVPRAGQSPQPAEEAGCHSRDNARGTCHRSSRSRRSDHRRVPRGCGLAAIISQGGCYRASVSSATDWTISGSDAP